jgi:hypothetical protein
MTDKKAVPGMTVSDLAPGFSIKDIVFTSKFDAAAAGARLTDMESQDPFKWRLLVGKHANPGGQAAFQTTCRFTPVGAPAGTQYGIKQLAYHMFTGSYFKGLGDENGSQTLGTTMVNHTWNLDCLGEFAGRSFAVSSLPFYSAQPSNTANGATGQISIVDAPGGTARLVRANILTGKRNFLRTYDTGTRFITMLVAVLPNNSHIPVLGQGWRFESRARVTWTDGKPTLLPSGLCHGEGLVPRDSLNAIQRRILGDSAAKVEDTILFKVNDSLFNAEMADTAAPVNPSDVRSEVRFTARNFEIIHSRNLLM